jgi:hypothetical protein
MEIIDSALEFSDSSWETVYRGVQNGSFASVMAFIDLEKRYVLLRSMIDYNFSLTDIYTGFAEQDLLPHVQSMVAQSDPLNMCYNSVTGHTLANVVPFLKLDVAINVQRWFDQRRTILVEYVNSKSANHVEMYPGARRVFPEFRNIWIPVSDSKTCLVQNMRLEFDSWMPPKSIFNFLLSVAAPILVKDSINVPITIQKHKDKFWQDRQIKDEHGIYAGLKRLEEHSMRIPTRSLINADNIREHIDHIKHQVPAIRPSRRTLSEV